MKYKTNTGDEFFMDEADWLHLSPTYNFCLIENGYVLAIMKNDGHYPRRQLLHRLIMSCPEGMVVDHINLNKTDNRRSNLRICTRAENNCNKISKDLDKHTSQYKGVKWHEGDQRWHAQLQVNKKYIWLGSYTQEKAAAERYDDAAAHFFREFALLNFPDRVPVPYVPKTPHKQHSVHKGISFDRTKKEKPWTACLQDKGVRWQMRFATEQEALEALNQKKESLAQGETLTAADPVPNKYSQHPGITKDVRKKSKPWRARIKERGVVLWQQSFESESEAIQALVQERTIRNLPVIPLSAES